MAEARPRITLYVRPWCGTVMRVKRWLNNRHIPFTEVDITKDAEAARRVEELNNGSQSVPTILIDGVHVATEPKRAELERVFAQFSQKQSK
jgi:mycoredoxin